jgi:hypothetical protein
MNDSQRKRYMHTDPIIFEEINEIYKTFKSIKPPFGDELNMGLFKYAFTSAKLRFLNILIICWTTY